MSESGLHLNLKYGEYIKSIEFYKKMYERTSIMGKIGVWECDLSTERLTWTDAVYDMFEIRRRSELDRSLILNCYEQNSRLEMEELRSQAIATCSTFTVDVSIRTALGNSRWIRITGDVEQENGRAARIFGTKQDITLERAAQLQIQALQTKLIHLSRLSAIDAMRSTLAHELNQPIAAIAVYVSALRNILGDGVVDQGATGEILDGLERCASKAGAIVREARHTSPSQRSLPVIFNLEDAICEACTIALAGVSDRLTIVYAMDAGLEVIGDPLQIQQVVINLVRNAYDAIESCEKREISIVGALNDAFAEFSIRDSGPGIAPEVIGTLFESFVSTKPAGAGIGLSISRTIIEAHTGKLTAENNADGGATFRFTVPLAL